MYLKIQKNRREAAKFFWANFSEMYPKPLQNTDPCASGDSRAPGFQKPLPEKKTMTAATFGKNYTQQGGLMNKRT